MKALVVVALLLAHTPALAWDVRCEQSVGVECTDPLDKVRHAWELHPRSEHRALLQRTLEISGLPGSFQLPFELGVFSNDETFEARMREFLAPGTIHTIGVSGGGLTRCRTIGVSGK